MSKFLFLTAVTCSLVLFSCKKDDNTSTPTIPKDSTPVIDPVALSANIKVGYGATSVKGDFPAASTDSAAPVLDTKYDGRTYFAVNNRYVIIYPNLKSGYVTGYYLKINGAGSYYKIDYTTARNLRKATHKKTNLRDGDNADSSIVIKLPAGLIGDTFTIKYAAYDSLNRVSNTLTAMVSIVAPASATDDNAVLGNWKQLRYKDNNDDWNYNVDSSSVSQYYCQDGVLYSGTNPGFFDIANWIYNHSITLSFVANNAMTYADNYTEDYFDQNSSSCSNLVYVNDYTDNYSENGGYSYNATTKVLTIIHDNNGTGSNITTDQYIVTELSNSKLSVYQINSENNSHDQLDITYYEYVK